MSSQRALHVCSVAALVSIASIVVGVILPAELAVYLGAAVLYLSGALAFGILIGGAARERNRQVPRNDLAELNAMLDDTGRRGQVRHIRSVGGAEHLPSLPDADLEALWRATDERWGPRNV